MEKITNYILIPIAVIVGMWLLYMTFFPHKIECSIDSIKWERIIYIEDLITYYEDDWNLPTGARLKYTQKERHHYDDDKEKWVYKTRYYYEIDRWTTVQQYESSGNDKNCYWNQNYTLSGKRRDTKRSENYNLIFSNGKHTYTENVKYDEFINCNTKEKYVITTSNFGIVYKSQIID